MEKNEILPYDLRMIIRDNTKTSASEVKIIEAVEKLFLSATSNQNKQPLEANSSSIEQGNDVASVRNDSIVPCVAQVDSSNSIEQIR